MPKCKYCQEVIDWHDVSHTCKNLCSKCLRPLTEHTLFTSKYHRCEHCDVPAIERRCQHGTPWSQTCDECWSGNTLSVEMLNDAQQHPFQPGICVCTDNTEKYTRSTAKNALRCASCGRAALFITFSAKHLQLLKDLQEIKWNKKENT